MCHAPCDLPGILAQLQAAHAAAVAARIRAVPRNWPTIRERNKRMREAVMDFSA
jgi:2-keto-3-deoxy-L-rhamnonate aldolase RhmA